MAIKIGNYDYKEIDYITKGTYGMVYEGRDIQNGKLVAIKLINNFETDATVQREVDILKTLKHENVVELFYYEVQGDKLYLVMEFFPDGDLQKMIGNQVISEVEIKNFLKQIVAGLSYINSKNIIHRDIKPANILVNKSAGKVIYKLTDFGISKLISKTQCMTFCGSPKYMAPEINDRQPASFKADVYSLGITIFVMMNEKIEKGSPTLRDLYEKMIKGNPKDRYSIEEVGKHPFLK